MEDTTPNQPDTPVETHSQANQPTSPSEQTHSTPQAQGMSSRKFDPASIYPDATHNSYGTSGTTSSNKVPMGLAGSQLQPEKKKLPIGIYIIAGLNLLVFVAGFLDSSQSSMIYIIAMFINLAIAVGLIMRFQAARKLALGVSVLILMISGVSLFLVAGLQQRLKDRKADYESATSRIDQSKITPAQKQQLDAIRTTIAAQEKQAGKSVAVTYLKFGLTCLEGIAGVIYLTRPKVKEIFH
ncbi:MAG TPA: hypothetical protein VF733_03280 [Candidatus Saccharimonadales bacterium]